MRARRASKSSEPLPIDDATRVEIVRLRQRRSEQGAGIFQVTRQTRCGGLGRFDRGGARTESAFIGIQQDSRWRQVGTDRLDSMCALI